ncbi:MAG: hypothetical protein MUC41_07920 [Syntrophobacteraceae bacterium]|nr:hypothetical protein [Syntrophobacteraceae bacterium]
MITRMMAPDAATPVSKVVDARPFPHSGAASERQQPMEYGLRHYEAVQRLFWFMLFLLCLFLAYPVAKSYQAHFASMKPAASTLPLDAYMSSDFWKQTQWLSSASMVNFAILYLVCAEALFMAARCLWLFVQFIGVFVVKHVLTTTLANYSSKSKMSVASSPAALEKLFPSHELFRKVNRFPFSLILHPFQRLRLMFRNPQSTLPAEQLVEKERRVSEADWQILSASWGPFRWVLWPLPFLALFQSSWMLYGRLQPLVNGQQDFQAYLLPLAGSFVPLVQIGLLTVLLNIGAALLKRLDNLYLATVDGLLYDQFLSRLPIQSGDTLILLEAMQRHFQELRMLLKRLEKPSASESESREPSD